ncbi:MAG: YraN family protein [Planctomycetota bacterium]
MKASRFKPAYYHTSTASIGRRGERVAAQYLRRRHYRILKRNYRCQVGEADLIALGTDRTTIVLVEVKTRLYARGERRPEANIDRAKQRKLRQVAEASRAALGLLDRPLRIDVIAVELRRWPARSTVRHIENAVSWTGVPRTASRARGPRSKR